MNYVTKYTLKTIIKGWLHAPFLVQNRLGLISLIYASQSRVSISRIGIPLHRLGFLYMKHLHYENRLMFTFFQWIYAQRDLALESITQQ